MGRGGVDVVFGCCCALAGESDEAAAKDEAAVRTRVAIVIEHVVAMHALLLPAIEGYVNPRKEAVEKKLKVRGWWSPLHLADSAACAISDAHPVAR